MKRIGKIFRVVVREAIPVIGCIAFFVGLLPIYACHGDRQACIEKNKRVEMLYSTHELCKPLETALLNCKSFGHCGCAELRVQLEMCNLRSTYEEIPLERSGRSMYVREPRKGMSTGEKAFLFWFLFL